MNIVLGSNLSCNMKANSFVSSQSVTAGSFRVTNESRTQNSCKPSMNLSWVLNRSAAVCVCPNSLQNRLKIPSSHSVFPKLRCCNTLSRKYCFVLIKGGEFSNFWVKFWSRKSKNKNFLQKFLLLLAKSLFINKKFVILR